MQVDYPYIPLVRINAPEIFADPKFKQWFFNRPKGCESAKYAPAIATWHQPQEADFGEYSDFFTTVDGGGGGDHADGDGSESDMPPQIWEQLVTAAWKALDRPEHFECLLWVSNLGD
jgi:hypothetical protein